MDEKNIYDIVLANPPYVDGKIAIVVTDTATNQDFSSFIASADVNTQFLEFFLLRTKHDFKTHQRGATIKEITTKILDVLEISYPSKPGQERIVNRIKECMTFLKQIVNVRGFEDEDVSDLRESILHKAFAGELCPL